jgi:DNA-binding MarR family transcriptional regulator
MRTRKSGARKSALTALVIRGGREYSIGTVLFHQAMGQFLGINATDMKCLDMMILHGPTTPTGLAEHTGLSSGATTALIDRLERANILRRSPHPRDRRATTLVLTKAARHRLPSLFQSLAGAMEELVSAYSESELKILADFFAKAAVLWATEREKLLGRSQTQTRTVRAKTKRRESI